MEGAASARLTWWMVDTRKRYSAAGSPTQREVSMRRLLKDLEERGESLLGYSRRTGAAYQTLIYWRRRLKALDATRRSAFVELPAANAISMHAYKLHITERLTLEIPLDIDPKALASLLRELDA
jgi:hypothetical protein